MATDSDLDDQLRAAMKVLDDEVPSGYWEALPNQTLARLEGSSMQQGTSGTTENKVAAAAPPMTAETTEDSGLHDIRNLAQSTKQRISSKRITSSQPVIDDPASSSGGWKAIALPQPAKMVALPELTELPSKKEIKAAEKAAAKERKVADVAADHATAQAAQTAAPVEAAPARSAFSLPSAQRTKSKGPLIAIVGLGVAAAAAAAIYVTTQKKADQAPAVARAETAAAPAGVTATAIQQNAAVGGAAGSAATPSPDVQKAEDDLAKQQAENDAMKAQLAAAQAAAPPAAPADEGKDAHAKAVKAPAKKGKGKLDTGAGSKVEETKTPPPPDKADKTKADSKTQKNADGSEPDFNDLLKEAGVDANKKEQKPKLDKKSLTGDDFKKGMSAIEDKAHGCYKGTQGSATVKLTIAPSGQISKISVTGPFAGKPEATCVAAAVRGASFPAWDGGPMTFTYPILLSE